MTEPRKPWVHTEQDAILRWMAEEKLIATRPELAQHFDISEASARRKADGLVGDGGHVLAPIEPRTQKSSHAEARFGLSNCGGFARV